MSADRVLVAGIGNIFLGDDGFGPEVIRRVRTHPLPRRYTVSGALAPYRDPIRS